MANIRQFDTGATRDTDNGKYDYAKFFSPIVLEKFAEYMHKNRLQKDGTMRDGDNWKKGFGDNHLDVCMQSLSRHYMDLWHEHDGYKSRDGIDDAICGVLFNVMAYYNKILNDRIEVSK